ncbi:MAG: formyltetrahydrofolate deformylase [Fibrobacterales bacterium]
MSSTAILLIHCKDQRGLVYSVTEFVAKNNGNIIDLEEHVDPIENVFFMRIEWDLKDFSIPKDKIGEFFKTLTADKFDITFKLYFSDQKPRMALFVSKYSHCFYDLLSKVQSGDLAVDVPVIISNHDDLREATEGFGIEYRYVPITKDTKAVQEAEELRILEEFDIDFVVLARYMQVLSDDFITHFKNDVINIHHSFLPAFVGAKPYHQAYKRGVKIIGATSHYVTAELDAGPIIEQDVAHVSHQDSIEDMVRKGRDVEKNVLGRAVWNHANRKVLSYKNKTVVFR